MEAPPGFVPLVQGVPVEQWEEYCRAEDEKRRAEEEAAREREEAAKREAEERERAEREAAAKAIDPNYAPQP
ncbi:hypothetical protein HK104_007772, partial [Borealophlyctis nickersoniae]